jgi:hypothetical protein
MINEPTDGWPGGPGALLSQWCAGHASVSTARRPGAGLVLRRRQSLERVHAVLVAEDTVPA